MPMGHSPYIIRDYWEVGSLFFDNHMIIVCFDVSYYLKQSIYILKRSLMWSLQAVKKGDTIFIGQYLFTGSETTSVWLEVGNAKSLK